MVNDIRTQSRAICPACFAQQATRNGRLVAHGYRRPWNGQGHVGDCNGVGAMHFGTVEGKTFTADYANKLRFMATNCEADACNVTTVYGTKRVARGVVQSVVIENPTEQQRARYAMQLRQTAVMMRQNAADLDAKVATWVAAEPKEVTVEVKTPQVHMYSTKMRGKMCASSMMGAMRGGYNNTTDATQVTCEKCKARLAKFASR